MPKKPYPPRNVHWYHPDREAPRPVFGIDVDGTLGQYHTHFHKFAEGYVGRALPCPCYSCGGYDGSVSFAKSLGLGKTKYREVKLAYRRGGLKRSMPVVEGASELVAGLRKRGAVVVICTTRPYLQLDNVEPDTREWLRRNRIQHDAVISGEHKYRDLKNMFGGARIVCVIDDLPEMVQQASSLGVYPLLIDARYNRSHWNGSGLRVSNLAEAEAEAHSLLDDWEAIWRTDTPR